jgi:cytoskeleton protein RodZ
MKNTGLLLKNRREGSGLSLSEVALATKINPKILNAIENGDEAALPARTFLKGFVRSYAVFLKMDVDEIIRSYNEEMGVAVPQGKPESSAAESKSSTEAQAPHPAHRRRIDEEESSKGFRTALVAVIVVLIGMIIGVRELIEKYQREKVVEVPKDLKVSPLVNEPAPVPRPEGKKNPIEQKVEQKTDDRKNDDRKIDEGKKDQATASAEIKPTDEPKAAENKPKAAENKIEEHKTEHKKPEDKPPVGEVKAEAVAVAETPPAAPAGLANEIILEALDKVEVKFQFKGETRRISLAASQVHTIRVDAPVILDLSDGGAVNIIFNGRELGVPGDLGRPKTVKIP